jgi:hypothetical protein
MAVMLDRYFLIFGGLKSFGVCHTPHVRRRVKDVELGCVYNFVTQAVPVAKNPIRKEMAFDTCLKILNFQFKSMAAQMDVCVEFK